MRYRTDAREVGGFDVVVCGGGTAGVAAAVAAARSGAGTALIEKSFSVGGSAYNAMVGPFMTCYDGKGEEQIVKGIFDEIVRRMEKRGGAIHPSKTGRVSEYGCFNPKNHHNVTPFEPEALKLVCFDMLGEAGVRLFLNHTLVDAAVEDGRVTGAVCFDSVGMAVFRAPVFVDATADAVLAFKAGVEFETGRRENGLTQPVSLFFSIYDVDDDQLIEYVGRDPGKRHLPYSGEVEEARARGVYTINRNKIGLYKMVRSGQWRLNTTRIQGVNPLCPDDMTAAYVEGVRQIEFLLDFFKTLPGLENAKLMQTAASIGIRDSRRIKGVHTLTADDIYDAREFNDVIALCAYPMDLHPATGSARGIQEGDRPLPNSYRIPYRILVPERLDGLLVAGRCVSATFEALGGIRIMPPVMAMGQAAGVAAAVSAAAGIQPRDIDVKDLQKRLRQQGAVL